MVLFCLPVDLLGLLNWRSNPDDLEQILQRLMEVEGGEIVKVSDPREGRHDDAAVSVFMEIFFLLVVYGSSCRTRWTPSSAS